MVHLGRSPPTGRATVVLPSARLAPARSTGSARLNRVVASWRRVPLRIVHFYHRLIANAPIIGLLLRLGSQGAIKRCDFKFVYFDDRDHIVPEDGRELPAGVGAADRRAQTMSGQAEPIDPVRIVPVCRSGAWSDERDRTGHGDLSGVRLIDWGDGQGNANRRSFSDTATRRRMSGHVPHARYRRGATAAQARRRTHVPHVFLPPVQPS